MLPISNVKLIVSEYVSADVWCDELTDAPAAFSTCTLGAGGALSGPSRRPKYGYQALAISLAIAAGGTWTLIVNVSWQVGRWHLTFGLENVQPVTYTVMTGEVASTSVALALRNTFTVYLVSRLGVTVNA